MQVQLLVVRGRLDEPRVDDVVGELGGEPPQVVELASRMLLLDRVPAGQAGRSWRSGQLVNLLAEQLDGVLPLWRYSPD